LNNSHAANAEPRILITNSLDENAGEEVEFHPFSGFADRTV
jgi:hypothetical protein